MRTRQLALTGAGIALLALGAGGTSPALAASQPSCSSGSTLAVSKSARVFEVKRAGIRRLYGCSNNQRTYLGRVGSKDRDTSALAVNGPRVAYVRTFCQEGPCVKNVLVHDLRKRKPVLSMAAAPGNFDDQKVTDLVLTGSGSVAWITDVNPDAPTARYVVAARKGLPLGQPPLVLAAGLDIVRGSLALAGNTLYFLQPTAKSAVLPS